MPSPTLVLAADLVPWWFAGAFWIAFTALVIMIGRDIRRLGGPRRVIGALRQTISDQMRDRSADPEPPTHP